MANLHYLDNEVLFRADGRGMWYARKKWNWRTSMYVTSLRFEDCFKGSLKLLKIDVVSWELLAGNWNKWRRSVKKMNSLILLSSSRTFVNALVVCLVTWIAGNVEHVVVPCLVRLDICQPGFDTNFSTY